MSEETKPVAYTYEERMAIQTIRKSMMKKPEIVSEIMKNGSYAMAERALLQARNEIKQLLEVTQAFTAAAAVLAKQQKEQAHADQDE